jgi:hypothetical protein
VDRLREGAARIERAVPRALPAPGYPPLWAAGAWVVVMAWLQMVRRPTDPPAWDSLYVEDGQIFLGQAISQHFWDSLATSHLGYLNTVARAITEVATWAPLEGAPLVMSLLTSLLVALLALYVFVASGAWIASPVLRFVLALAVVLVPVTGRDIAGTVANLHWYLIYASFWAVLSPWRSRTWLAVSTAVVLLGVLSDPLCGLLLPFAIVLAVRAGRREAWALPGAMVFGLIVQLILRDEAAERIGGVEWAVLPRLFAERVTSSLVAGDRYLYDLFGGRTGSLFAWASLAAVVLAVGLGLRRLRGRRRWLLASGATLSLVFFLLAVVARGTELLVPDIPWALGASRYMYLPVMFILTGLIAAADRPGAERTGRRLVAELVVVALVVGGIAVNYRIEHRTSGEPRWGPAVDQARAACAARRPAGTVTLIREESRPTAVIPTHRLGHWNVQIACSDID